LDSLRAASDQGLGADYLKPGRSPESKIVLTPGAKVYFLPIRVLWKDFDHPKPAHSPRKWHHECHRLVLGPHCDPNRRRAYWQPTKAIYTTKTWDTGDFVMSFNAAKVRHPGKKETQKTIHALNGMGWSRNLPQRGNFRENRPDS